MRRTGQRATRLLTRFRRNGEIHRLPDRAVVRALRDLTEDHHGCTRRCAAPEQALRGRAAAGARRRCWTVATFQGSSSSRVRASGASSRASSRRGGVWVAWGTPELDSLVGARRSDGALACRSPSASRFRGVGSPAETATTWLRDEWRGAGLGPQPVPISPPWIDANRAGNIVGNIVGKFVGKIDGKFVGRIDGKHLRELARVRICASARLPTCLRSPITTTAADGSDCLRIRSGRSERSGTSS